MRVPRYLLDTNTVSYFIKDSYPGVRARLLATPAEALAVSAITVAELRFWVSSRPESARVRVLIDEFLRRVPTLAWDVAAAETYGDTRAHLKRIGRPIAGLDLLIASHAIALGATLVTHDQVLAQIPMLAVEDWVQGSGMRE